MIKDKSLIISYGIVVLLVIIDIITKSFVFSYNSAPSFEMFFSIVPSQNKGSAFGIFSNIPYYSSSIVILSFGIIGYLVYKTKDFINNSSFLVRSFFILFLSGLIGNTIDRAYLGYVRDFIHIPYFAIINFADIYLTFATLIIIVVFLRENTLFYSPKRKQNFKNSNSKIKYKYDK